MSTFHGEVIEPRLIYKGAEAELYLESWHGQLVVRKSRIPKPYRLAALDESIRQSRTSHEAGMMHEVRKLGVPVPSIVSVNLEDSTFLMDFVRGPSLKEDLSALSLRKSSDRCRLFGRLVADMHAGGIVHGDLTISNVISQDGQLFLIDFGLSSFSEKTEDRGVDLLLLNRALKSTHYDKHTALFRAFFNGYSIRLGKSMAEQVLGKMHEIERRGRYFERG